jgi:cytochrome c biogenesis protein ResB
MRSSLTRTLSSLKTSLYLMGAMTVMFVLGTVFPQGMEYEKYVEAGGRAPGLVKALGLLDIFASPVFLALAALLCLNLLVCILERLRGYLRVRANAWGLSPPERLLRHPHTLELGPQGRLEQTLERLSRRFRTRLAEPRRYVLERGLPYWWLSWLYHLGIVVAVAGFLSTYLAAFEGTVTLWQDAQKPVEIQLWEPESRLNRLLARLGGDIPRERPERSFRLRLLEFRTEHYQALGLQYPRDGLSRLALALGMGELQAQEPTLVPKMWLSRVWVQGPRGQELEGELWVNRPLRLPGLVLYQMAFEQEIALRVAGRLHQVKAFEPFELEGLQGKLRAGMVKTGRVQRKDGTWQEIEKPFFELTYTDPEGRRKRLGRLTLGEGRRLLGRSFKFEGLREASVLSYRHDPGVGFIEVAVWMVFAGLLLRCLGYWVRVELLVHEGRLYAHVSTRGLLASREAVVRRYFHEAP